MLITFLNLLARLPMRWYYRLGSFIGWTGYRCSRVDAARLRANLYQSGIYSGDREYRALLREVVTQSGRSVSEWLKAWYAPQAEIDRLCVECAGWESVETVRRGGRGLFFYCRISARSPSPCDIRAGVCRSRFCTVCRARGGVSRSYSPGGETPAYPWLPPISKASNSFCGL